MSVIYGVGTPSKIRRAGTEYIDTQTGIRYNQNDIPSGNNWTRMDDSSSSSGSVATGFPGVLYYISKEFSHADLLAATTPILIGQIPTDENGGFLISSVSLLYSGTSMSASSSLVSVYNSTDEEIAFFIGSNVFISNNPLDLKSATLVNPAYNLTTSGNMDLYFGYYISQFNPAPTGGDSTSWAKIIITYSAF